jgi:tripartite ATP-independent transporter DctM subunit
MLSVYAIIKGKKSQVIVEAFSWPKAKAALLDAFWILPLPFLVLGGIYGGFFTPFEAAAVTAIYVLVLELLIYRDIKLFRDIPRITAESMVLVGGILLILGCALGLTNFLVDEQIPMKAVEFVRQYIHSKFVFLIALNVFLLLVGCMMDIFSAIIVVVPLILPIATEFGVNPIHLGIIFLTNLEIGYSTPPVGLNLFISSYRFKKKIPELYRASLPFLAVLFLALLIITYFPELSLFLVKSFGYQ